MSEFGEIQGYMFHFREGKPLMEGDNLIPAYACLCAARSALECGCGAFDWPIPKRDEMEKIESIARNYQPTTDGNDMNTNIEALVAKHIDRDGWSLAPDGDVAMAIRNALTEQAEAFNGELQAYDGMVRELTKTVEDMREAQVVPVVGEPAGYFPDESRADEIDAPPLPVYFAPTHSITAAELATLREKAAEADELRKDAERLQFMLDETAILMYSVGIDRTLCRVEWPLTGYVQDAFYPSERAAIDAAIAQGKGE